MGNDIAIVLIIIAIISFAQCSTTTKLPYCDDRTEEENALDNNCLFFDF